MDFILDYFLDNESTVNIISIVLMFLSFVHFNINGKPFLRIINHALFTIGYITILLNTLSNGIVKGF